MSRSTAPADVRAGRYLEQLKFLQAQIQREREYRRADHDNLQVVIGQLREENANLWAQLYASTPVSEGGRGEVDVCQSCLGAMW